MLEKNEIPVAFSVGLTESTVAEVSSLAPKGNKNRVVIATKIRFFGFSDFSLFIVIDRCRSSKGLIKELIDTLSSVINLQSNPSSWPREFVEYFTSKPKSSMVNFLFRPMGRKRP